VSTMFARMFGTSTGTELARLAREVARLETERDGYREAWKAAEAETVRRAGSLAAAEAELEQWRALVKGAGEDAGRVEKRYASLVAAIEAELEKAPRCMHTWPCSRENCSRARYAGGLARALDLAHEVGRASGDEAGGEP
jgi:outer membrane murein-binding lipoprotein Lpp